MSLFVVSYSFFSSLERRRGLDEREGALCREDRTLVSIGRCPPGSQLDRYASIKSRQIFHTVAVDEPGAALYRTLTHTPGEIHRSHTAVDLNPFEERREDESRASVARDYVCTLAGSLLTAVNDLENPSAWYV